MTEYNTDESATVADDSVDVEGGDLASPVSDLEDRISKLEKKIRKLEKHDRDVSVERLRKLEFLCGVQETEEGVPVGVDVTVPEE